VLKPERGVAAFFDLDKTLITINSARLWITREYRLGRISFFQLLQGTAFILLYHLGLVDMDVAMGKAIATVGGLPEEDLRRRTEKWFGEEVAPFAAPGSRRVLDQHRREGHLNVLLTTSSPYASRCAAELFGLDAFLCSSFEVVEGRFTGKYVAPLCYGQGKVHYARRFARERHVDLEASFFYTDSYTDLPMLEAVGNPRIVHPDPRLRREARRRDWPILDWH